jgi:hypothetical protein
MIGAQHTEIGKKGRRLEALVIKKLKKVFNKEIKPLLGNTSIGSLQNSEIGQKVRNIIRSAVEIGYVSGALAVSGFLRDPNPITTEQDFGNIQAFAAEMESEFWGMVGKQENRAEEVEVVDNALQKMEPYNQLAALVGIGSFIAFYSLNHGIISKTHELAPQVGGLPAEDILDRFGRKALITVQDRLISPSKSPVILVYLTASDSLVDPEFCAPLHRMEFEVGDNLPELPQHRHCRCVLVPKNQLTNEFMI